MSKSSDDLLDEIEAINSIYGTDSLQPTSPPTDDDGYLTFILDIPSAFSSSFRLRFPPDYPSSHAPPEAVSIVAASASERRGVATTELGVFKAALASVWTPGQVCLFDAIEEARRVLSEKRQPEEEVVEKHWSGDRAEVKAGRREQDGGTVGLAASAALTVKTDEEAAGSSTSKTEAAVSLSSLSLNPNAVAEPEPPWIISDPVTELRSTFIARCAPCTSPAQASAYISHLLATDRRARTATHNISAWRIFRRSDKAVAEGGNEPAASNSANNAYQDYDSDGETAAGGRLLRLLQLTAARDVVVVVSRWFGGQKLGPRRFALINAVARDALVKGGFVQGEGQAAGGAGSAQGKKDKKNKQQSAKGAHGR